MPPKIINLFLAAAVCLSLFAGIISYLTAAPDAAVSQPAGHSETAPTAIASDPQPAPPIIKPGGGGPGGSSTNGNSWGG